MKKHHLPLFKLSVLSLALAAGTTQAVENNGATVTLDAITVTGNAVPTIVTDKQLDQRVATDLKQAMKDQVGMSISGGNGVAQYYSIRGMGEDKINLEVDGTSYSSSVLHHQGRFMLDPALTKVIDVEKGTGSASAGIGALGGVIRVTTVDASDLLTDGEHVGLKIGATGSTNRGFSTNLAAYAHQNGFDALFAGNFLQNGNYKDGEGKKNYGSKLDQNSYLAKVGYDFNENHQLRVSLRQEYQQGRRLPTIEFAYDNTKEAAVGESDSAQRQRTLNLEYNAKQLGFISKLNANVFHTQVDDYKPPKRGNNISNDSISMELTKMLSTGANLNLSSEIGAHELKYGLNFRNERTKSSNKESWWNAKAAYHDQKKNEYGAYLEGIWNLDPVTLTTGIRYDAFKYYDGKGQSVSHGKINPSVNIIYSVTPDLLLLATYNQASRAPRLVEALLSSERFTGFSADKNLKEETARRGELGFKWQHEGFQLSANIFQQNISDLIIYKSDRNNSNNSTVYNDGKLKMRGYEVDASYRYAGFKARVAVSQAKPKLYSTGKNTYQEDPYYFWNIGRQWLTSLSYRFENPNLELGWTGRYFQHTSYYNSRLNNNQGGFAKKAGYGVHDLFVNWQPLNNEKFNVNFGVNNLFNKQYLSHSQRGNSGFAERGREFVAGFNYKF